MEKILIFIKHHFPVFWKVIESINSFVFSLLYKNKLDRILSEVMDNTEHSWTIRILNPEDAESLYLFIESQPPNDLKYFNPHGFDRKKIQKQFKVRSFLMMGVFDKDKLVGYFFLRFFANKKCFVGRLIDVPYRGTGIGHVMNNVMYEIAWNLNFRCLSTISKNNKAVIKSHKKNSSVVVLKNLSDDYMLIEFVKR